MRNAHEAKSQATLGANAAIDLARVMIAGHYILVLYGHWAVNDLRGSGSHDFIDLKLAPLGPIYFGRKPHEEQPSREELREFHRKHQELLKFPVIWIDDEMRSEIASAVEAAVRERGYTCYAFAICANHLHLIIRKHKDNPLAGWNNLADAIRSRLRLRFPQKISAHHPVISARPYKTYVSSPAKMWDRIDYLNDNPEKDGLTPQRWEFVKPSDNWPQHNTLGSSREAAIHHA